MASIFTKIVNGDIPCYKIAENDKFFAFLDIRPLQAGHTLVIPKNEINYFFDIEDNDLSEMIVFAKNIAKAIRKAYPCNKVGMTVIGLEVLHAHIHLIPINSEADMRFTNQPKQFNDSEFQEIVNNIRKCL